MYAQKTDLFHVFVLTQSGFTPLHIACVYGHFELARLLLEAGADIQAKTKNGYMALHLAAQYGHQWIIDLLLEYGAPPDALTNVSNFFLFSFSLLACSTF